MKRIVLVLAVAGIITQAQADVLHLKDGNQIEGDVKKTDAGWVVTLPDGQSQTVSAADIKSIQAGTNTNASEPLAGLDSLRRSTENVNDPHQVIDRYNRFIGQYPGTPAGTQAKQDLAVWQSRIDRDMVRVGKSWMSKADREHLQQDSLQFADQARQQIKDGHWKEAGTLLNKALDADPQSVTALYLRSLVEYQAGQFVTARKDLEVVKALTPNHGPTLNNLGVITARQNRFGESVSYFDQAMRAAPADRIVVDNVAEALHAMVSDAQRATVQKALAQRASATFQTQDAMLQTKMKDQGLHRWGATWVNDADMAKLNEAQRQINEQVKTIQADWDATQQQMAGIDQRIAGDESTLRQLESDTYRQDINTGQIITLPLSPVYYDVQRDLQTQHAAKQQALAKIETLRTQAKNVQRQLPIPKYTGTLQVVGADGAPILIMPAPTADATATKPAPATAGS